MDILVGKEEHRSSDNTGCDKVLPRVGWEGARRLLGGGTARAEAAVRLPRE